MKLYCHVARVKNYNFYSFFSCIQVHWPFHEFKGREKPLQRKDSRNSHATYLMYSLYSDTVVWVKIPWNHLNMLLFLIKLLANWSEFSFAIHILKFSIIWHYKTVFICIIIRFVSIPIFETKYMSCSVPSPSSFLIGIFFLFWKKKKMREKYEFVPQKNQ